jgi:hypothetical protein
MKKSKWFGIVLGALMLASVGVKFANAASQKLNGFVCDVSWYPKKLNSSFGNHGALFGSIYTQPYCDPTANGFSEAQLSALLQNLQRHMSSALKVQMQGLDTNSTGMSLITFSAQYQ